MAIRRLLTLLILLLVSACGSYDYAPPPPTPEHLSIIHTPALGWMRELLHQCTVDHPEVALTVEERPATALELGAAEAVLKLGPPPEGLEGQVTLLGWEQIVIISDPNIAPSQLELPDLQQVYTSLAPAYQAWSYPENDELRVIFDEVVLTGKEISPHTKIAPNPRAMLASVEGDSNAVGYIPQSWLAEENIQLIPIIKETGAALRQPILAITMGQPEGVTRTFLACLTDAISQHGNSQ